MKVTYTADDGSNWESEADCLGWERFLELRAAAELTASQNERYELGYFLAAIANEDGSNIRGMQDIWKERECLYQLVELMKEAERGSN